MLNYLLPSAWILDEVKDSHLKILKETERISIAKKKTIKNTSYKHNACMQKYCLSSIYSTP